MPTLPSHIAETQARGALRVDPRLPSVGDGLATLGEGLDRTADVLLWSREQDEAADAALDISSIEAKYDQRFRELQDAALPGAPDFTPALMREYDAEVAAAIARGKTRRGQDFRRARLTGDNRRLLFNKAIEFERNEKLRHREEKLSLGLNNVAVSAETDPDNYGPRLAEYLAALDQIDAPPIEKDARRRNAMEIVQMHRAIGYVRRDPDAALKRLLAPQQGDTAFSGLTPKARDSVLSEYESWQRIRLQAEDRAYRDAERAERDLYDETSKEGDKRLAEGNLTPAWIEANRSSLSADDYRYFRRALSGEGGAGPRDVEAYADLRDRVSRGEDVRDEARAALRAGKIQVGDYDRLVGEAEASRPGWYKRGVDFITNAGKPSELNPPEGAQQRFANMLDDWQQWSVDNPKASDSEARDAYQRIVSEYELIDTKNLVITLAAPRFMVGNRQTMDLDATEAATVQAFQEKRISEAEAQKQALLIQQWRRALEKQAGTK